MYGGIDYETCQLVECYYKKTTLFSQSGFGFRMFRDCIMRLPRGK